MKYKIGDKCPKGHIITKEDLTNTKVGQSRCRLCAKEVHKRFRIKNKEKLKVSWAKWKQKNPDKIRATVLKHKYGISLKDVSDQLIRQDNKCAICACHIKPVQSNGKVSRDSLCIDHDHNTGKVRGLLCNSCNTGLGKFKDSLDNLLRAVWYLYDASH